MTVTVPSPRAAQPVHRPTARGATVWLTGLPSAGKSTVAAAAADRLRSVGRAVELLDGDVVRRELCSDLGFSREDRMRNIARIGYLAHMLARNGVLVLAAVIAPYADARQQVRARHERDGVTYLEAYVATPLSVCRSRDVKGLYAKQQAGKLHGLTGVDDVYEAPISPEILLHTQDSTIDQSVAVVFDELATRGLV